MTCCIYSCLIEAFKLLTLATLCRKIQLSTFAHFIAATVYTFRGLLNYIDQKPQVSLRALLVHF